MGTLQVYFTAKRDLGSILAPKTHQEYVNQKGLSRKARSRHISDGVAAKKRIAYIRFGQA
jgi:hypothetical protein